MSTALGMSPAQLAAQIGSGGRANPTNAAGIAIMDDLAMLAAGGDGSCRERALAMLRASVAGVWGLDERALRGRIDKRGAANPENLSMKGCALDLAWLHHLARDGGAAADVESAKAGRMAAVILLRYAEVFPEWPLVSREGELFRQEDKAYLARWDANGLWGSWFSLDLLTSLPVLRAFDLIGGGGTLGGLGPEAGARVERDLLRHQVGNILSFPVGFGNMDHELLIGLCQYGRLLPEPEFIHRAVRWLGQLLRAGYYADGMWHEGSPDYHKDITWGLTKTLPGIVRGWTDPAGFRSKIDGGRFDALDLDLRHGRRFGRMWDALNKYALPPPGRFSACVHDTAYPREAWWAPALEASSPRLLGCAGHAVLGMGRGDGQSQVHLHFSGMHGHEHSDTLNLLGFVGGREMLSETSYHPLPGDGASTREWQASVAGHNTVMIDGREMLSRMAEPRRRLGRDDAMGGIPDWHWRDYGHGDSLTDGRLRFMEARWDGLQVTEAEGERSYGGLAKLYRRTVAMVGAGVGRTYIFDVFRVRGGSRHDWMLHGCLQELYSVRVGFALKPRGGTEHGFLGGLRSAETQGDWAADFVYEDGAIGRVHMLGQPRTEVSVAEAPAMRRLGNAEFLMVRHGGGESCFVAVHDLGRGAPGISSVRRLALQGGGPQDVAVEVALADGRRDVIVSAFADEAREMFAGGQVHVRGRFAHVRFGAGGKMPEWAHLVGGAKLAVGEDLIAVDRAAWSSGIRKTLRVEAGDAVDALEVDVALPPAGLEGAVGLVDFDEALRQAFVIRNVEQIPGGSRVVLEDDPGFDVGGNVERLQYFPGWGVRGSCRLTVITAK